MLREIVLRVGGVSLEYPGGQRWNRTTDTGIFNPLKLVGKSELPSGDVRQGGLETRQGGRDEAQ